MSALHTSLQPSSSEPPVALTDPPCDASPSSTPGLSPPASCSSPSPAMRSSPLCPAAARRRSVPPTADVVDLLACAPPPRASPGPAGIWFRAACVWPEPGGSSGRPALPGAGRRRPGCEPSRPMVRVTVWGENVHEPASPTCARSIPTGCTPRSPPGSARLLGERVRVRTATLEQPEHGLSDDGARRDRRPDLVGPRGARGGRRRGRGARHAAVLGGMGLLVLHSGTTRRSSAR